MVPQDITTQRSAVTEEVKAALICIEHALNTFKNTGIRKSYPLDDAQPTSQENQYSMVMIFDDIFDYAVMGSLSAANRIDHDDVTDIAAFLATARPAMEFYEGYGPEACERIYSMMVARSKLDTLNNSFDYGFTEIGNHLITGYRDDLFTLAEVSLLANMNEKSVRNATHQTKDDRLETTKVGGRTYVTAKAAAKWLNERRGFTPTKSESKENA